MSSISPSTKSYDEVIARVKQRAASAAPGDGSRAAAGTRTTGRCRSSRRSRRSMRPFPIIPCLLRRVDGHAIDGQLRRDARRRRHRRDDGSRRRTHRPRRERQSDRRLHRRGQQLVERAMPPISAEQRKARVLASAQAIAANGLTEMHDAGIDGETITRRAGAHRREAFPDPRLRDARR